MTAVLRHWDHAGVARDLDLQDATAKSGGWKATLGAGPGCPQPGATASGAGRPARCRRCAGRSPEEAPAARPANRRTAPGHRRMPHPARAGTRRRPPDAAAPVALLRPAARQPLPGRLPLITGLHRATLVPPHLTMPLMDEVLIPFQNGQKIDPAP